MTDGIATFAHLNIQVTQTLDGDEFKPKSAERFSHWKRGKALLDMASKAHILRTHRAWDDILKSHASD